VNEVINNWSTTIEFTMAGTNNLIHDGVGSTRKILNNVLKDDCSKEVS
jgi:hypothetical protein